MSQLTPRRNPLNIDENLSDSKEQLAYTGGNKIVDHPNSARKFTKVKLLGKADLVSTRDWIEGAEDTLHEDIRNAQRHESLPVGTNRVFPDGEGNISEDPSSNIRLGQKKQFELPGEDKWMHTEDVMAADDSYRWTRKPVPKPCPSEEVRHIGKKVQYVCNVRTESHEPTPKELQGSIRMRARFDNSQRILSEPNFVTPTDLSCYNDKEFHVKPVQFGTAGRYEHSPLPTLETLQGVLTPMDDDRQRKPMKPAPFGTDFN